MSLEVEAVWKLIDQLVQPLPFHEVKLIEAAGLVLAQDAPADRDHPAFDRSAVDGYAIGAEDASETFQVIESVRAGESKALNLKKGEAVRIMTGAELPSAGLKVLMQEHVLIDGVTFRIDRAEADTNIRRRGEDFQAGDILLRAGAELGPAELSTLASIGLTAPQVIRRPRVLHFTGGDEIVPPEVVPGAGKIRDTNSILVRALLGKSNVTEVRHTHLPDDLVVAHERIEAASCASFDCLLFSGGASVGDHDFTERILRELGFEIHGRQVNVRPGRPLIFATRGSQIAFGIPGNPVSHFACYHLFIARALARLSGRSPARLEKAVLAAAIPGKSNPRVTFWPARLAMEEATRQLIPLSWKSSGDLASLVGVNALIRIEGNQTLPEAGAHVDCLLV